MHRITEWRQKKKKKAVLFYFLVPGLCFTSYRLSWVPRWAVLWFLFVWLVLDLSLIHSWPHRDKSSRWCCSQFIVGDPSQAECVQKSLSVSSMQQDRNLFCAFLCIVRNGDSEHVLWMGPDPKPIRKEWKSYINFSGAWIGPYVSVLTPSAVSGSFARDSLGIIWLHWDQDWVQDEQTQGEWTVILTISNSLLRLHSNVKWCKAA